MVAKLFDAITRGSIRFRWVTIALAVLALVLGIVAITQLNQELLPPIEFPVVVAVTMYGGADADQVLEEVTVPLENAVRDIEGIVNVESNTGPGFSAISLRTEFGLDQEAIKEEVAAALNAIPLPEGVDPPRLLSFGLSDIPVVAASVSSEDLSIAELKELVESSILPELRDIPGVEDVLVSGGQELPTEPPPTEPPTPTPTVTPTHTPSPTPTAMPTEEPQPTDTPEAAGAPAVEPWPEVAPVPLPEEWAGGAKAMGLTLETTADITPEMMSSLASMQPQMLALFSLEMWQALAPETLAAVPALALGYVNPEIAAEVADLVEQARQYVVAVEATKAEEVAEAPAVEPWPEVESVPLPEEWVEGAKAMGLTLETTADITPEMMSGLATMQPQMLTMFPLEMWQALAPETLAAVPDSALDYVDPEIAGTVAELVGSAQEYVAALEAAAAPGTPEPEATEEVVADPTLLPAFWQAAGQQQGVELERASDITVEILRGVIGFAPQLLDTLTPEHLKAMSPEALAWLPEDYIESLPADLRAELEALAAPAGGLGAQARQEAEEAARLAAEAPQLPESWRQPPESDSPVEMQFETAADLLKNPFGVSAAELLNLLVEMGTVPNAPELLADLTPEVVLWLAGQDAEFLTTLNPGTLRLLSPKVLTALPETFLEDLDPELREELAGIAAGTVTVFIPEGTINRTNGHPSLALVFYKGGDENTVKIAHAIFDKLAEMEGQDGGLHYEIAFEQSSFIEESISGVAREGALGAVFAIVMILFFLSGIVAGRLVLSWRSTLVIAVSIPLSVFMAFAMMWLAPILHEPFQSLADATAAIPVVSTLTLLLARLFPSSMTLNIMTLSGMTVAVGRVVDDSIVVLENIYRRIQRGDELYEAVVGGTRDVAIAIFASTVTTVIVFLPLGLIGGLVGEFFMPFGLTVTYALMASFLVAITVVPTLAYLFIRKEQMPPSEETWMQRTYTPMLKWALGHRFWTLFIATVLFVGSVWLMAQRPQAFIPSMGEPTLNVSVDMPNGATMDETDALAREMETYLATLDAIEVYQTEVGTAGGMSMEAFFGRGIDQGAAGLTISAGTKEELESLTPDVRAEAERIFGAEHVVVSADDMASAGFGGFDVVLSGDPDDLVAVDGDVIAALEGIDGLVNVSSNLTAGDMIIRVDGQRAVSYAAELETRDTMGVTTAAKEAVVALDLPEGMEITEGFTTREQTQGFADMARALVISIAAVYVVMALTFRSLIHPFTILFSLPLALIGASLGLALTDRVLGISAMIGLMMLVGVVVTNAIVLLERVQQNRKENGMDAYDALIEAGRTRLRPIWMTALAAILALIPLALGFTEGALIASELATVVIGGLLTSTLLTLIIVPVAYSLFDGLGSRITRLWRRD